MIDIKSLPVQEIAPGVWRIGAGATSDGTAHRIRTGHCALCNFIIRELGLDTPKEASATGPKITTQGDPDWSEITKDVVGR